MIDIGANLSSDRFDLPAVLKRAFESNLDSIILTTTDLKSFHTNIYIIKNYPQYSLFTTLGLHPHNAQDYQFFFQEFDNLIDNAKIVSIGEFGLDYYRMISDKKTQRTVMQQFMEKCKHHSLPLFLHERGAFDDFVAILKEHNTAHKKVVHCFTGSKEQLKVYLDLDCYIGITGWVTDDRRNRELKEALKYIPPNRLMIETDCPYLTPKNMPQPANTNEPAYLYYINLYLSAQLGKDSSQLINIINKNTKEFFSI